MSKQVEMKVPEGYTSKTSATKAMQTILCRQRIGCHSRYCSTCLFNNNLEVYSEGHKKLLAEKFEEMLEDD